VSSGLTDAERAHIASHPDQYVGKLITLAHHGVQDSGALRHPVYVGVRNPSDKAPAATGRRTERVLDEATIKRATSGAPGRRRNYAAMKAPKLLTSIASLRSGSGDAYQKCMEKGSKDPDGDLTAALDAARRKGLSV
jgi:hypothetical protein